MKTAQTEELEVTIPDYIDRFLFALAKGTGRTKEDVALFFLLKKAEHARPKIHLLQSQGE